jgi:hypothetical protein
MKKQYDTYGIGQELGCVIVAYCKKKHINIDDLFEQISQNKSIFIDGMKDGVGGNRDCGEKTLNYSIESLKI